MRLPPFDLGEAFNILIGGLVTVCGVILGGWLAFRAGLRHLRLERLMDRRLRWYEQVIAALDEYLGIVGYLLRSDRQWNEGVVDNTINRAEILRHATDSGRTFGSLLSQGQFFSASLSPDPTTHLRVAQLNIYMASWERSTDAAKENVRLAEVETQLATLVRGRSDFINSIRGELGLQLLSSKARDSSNGQR